MKTRKLLKIIGLILCGFLLSSGLIFGTTLLFTFFDRDIDNWIFTFPETYPELKPLACEIIKDGKITGYERWQFSIKVKEVQKRHLESDYKKEMEKLQKQCSEGRKE